MSVVLRCVKCNGVMEAAPDIAPNALRCPNCGPGRSPPAPESFEDEALSLLTEIRDELRKLTG